MAKEEKKPDAKGDAKAHAPEAAPAKKGGKKVIGMVGAIVIAQGVITFGAFSMVGPKASHAKVDTHELHKDETAATKEITMIAEKDGRFPNHMTGSVWVWSTEIVAQVKVKNAEAVEAKLKARQAEVKEEIARIFAKAQQAHLKEPDRQTLNRQISAVLNKIFGKDEKDEPLIERVLIPKCIGVSAQL
ncbi:hypothetical protein BH11PLA1_BH11PLA1_09030 [soil metagenome]